MHQKELNNLVGNVDIYLLDQILKGTFDNTRRILDAGCGEGRNLQYFVNNRMEVHGVDINPMAIKMARITYKTIPIDQLQVENLTELPYKDGYFDSVICMAVLHFATNENEFKLMLSELSRVLKSGGTMLIRMATDVGLNSKNNGSFTYLLEGSKIDVTFAQEELFFSEPWKSVVVEGKRSMGTFLLHKL
ncbi:class I SAM-dependent methyltransferase [Fulvivirga lutimaris]|uniref:class I SAM-dependent methyltransferase n=1 Tax=Fulvivirga lutimaris TaxID=1819566 RepID=UPI0012BD65E2|nr:class I SAM-dependent methyltransferase [Fulvivirga lutimaris]MTI41106.1 class I SAM-dependent methyltransferase [Fulvivirga lutimaris]